MENLFYTSATKKNKHRSIPHGFKSLSSNFFRFWQLGVLDITSVNSALHDEAELENYLNEKEVKYFKVCVNRYDSQKLQYATDNQKSTSESDNSVEPSFSLSRLFRKKKSPVLYCAMRNEEDLSENLHAAGSDHAKRKAVNVKHNKNFTEKWKEITLTIQAF